MFMRLTPANSHRKYDPGVNCRRFAKSQSDTLPAMMLAIIPAAATMRLEPVELSATVEIEISGSSNDVPGGVGIVDVHRPCHRVGGGAEILLANESIVIDNERHDPCRVILSRPGDEREAAG